MTKRHKNIHVGTSGWSYGHWKGPFYPEHLPSSRMLDYYAEHFRSVEINGSFYHLPAKETLKLWHDETPKNFLFSAKGSRYITHMKKLKNPQQSVGAFLRRIRILGDKLGPILFQLPPRWHFNSERLANFLNALSKEFRYAFEFRDQSWLNDEAYELLSKHDAALCIYDFDGFLSPKRTTTDLVYMRLHGPNGPYQGDYDHKSLSSWAGALNLWADERRTGYCYFDNDEQGYAVRNAGQLQSML
jgi:uncharacterized protein YecE (DUF72 family)